MADKKHLIYKEDVLAMAWLADECEVVSVFYIEDLPVVEAVPVVHGRWNGPFRVDANNNKYECSECGFWGVPGWVACPKCGARMDLEN